jgi:hypothetical protein
MLKLNIFSVINVLVDLFPLLIEFYYKGLVKSKSPPPFLGRLIFEEMFLCPLGNCSSQCPTRRKSIR